MVPGREESAVSSLHCSEFSYSSNGQRMQQMHNKADSDKKKNHENNKTKIEYNFKQARMQFKYTQLLKKEKKIGIDSHRKSSLKIIKYLKRK